MNSSASSSRAVRPRAANPAAADAPRAIAASRLSLRAATFMRSVSRRRREVGLRDRLRGGVGEAELVDDLVAEPLAAERLARLGELDLRGDAIVAAAHRRLRGGVEVRSVLGRRLRRGDREAVHDRRRARVERGAARELRDRVARRRPRRRAGAQPQRDRVADLRRRRQRQPRRARPLAHRGIDEQLTRVGVLERPAQLFDAARDRVEAREHAVEAAQPGRAQLGIVDRAAAIAYGLASACARRRRCCVGGGTLARGDERCGGAGEATPRRGRAWSRTPGRRGRDATR